MQSDDAPTNLFVEENENAKVAIVDDDAAALKSLTRVVMSGGYRPFAFASARDFLADSECAHVRCVVSDLRMPELDGLELQRVIHERFPHLSFVLITGVGNIPVTVTAMKAGAIDFLEKPVMREVLLEAIGRAIRRSDELLAKQATSNSLRSNYTELTAREREIFALVSAGLLNKQIAAQIGIAEKTVKQHRGRVVRKMRADSLADLVIMADRLGVRPHDRDFSHAKGRLAISGC